MKTRKTVTVLTHKSQ